MTDEMKKTGGEKVDAARPTIAEDADREEFKVVELGRVEDEDALLDEVSVRLGNLEKEKTPDAAETRKTTPPGGKKRQSSSGGRKKEAMAKKRPAAAAPAGRDGPTASAPAQEPAAAENGRDKKPSPAYKTAGAGAADSHRKTLEEARLRSAEAARKARQKKTGRGLLFFLVASGLLVALGAAAGFYLFKPSPPPPPAQKPVKFAVKNAPGLKFEVPASEPAKVVDLGPKANAAAEAGSAGGSPEPAEGPPELAGQKTARPPEQPGSAEAPDASVHKFLSSWKAAWEASAGPSGRIGPYISHFSKDFQAGGMDRAQWKADKAAKNRRKDWIRIGLENIKISRPAEDGTVTVHFLQTYESSNYSDKTDKTIVLQRETGDWKILGFGSEGQSR